MSFDAVKKKSHKEMWTAEMKCLLLGNKFRGAFADVQHVLLIGVSSSVSIIK